MVIALLLMQIMHCMYAYEDNPESVAGLNQSANSSAAPTVKPSPPQPSSRLSSSQQSGGGVASESAVQARQPVGSAGSAPAAAAAAGAPLPCGLKQQIPPRKLPLTNRMPQQQQQPLRPERSFVSGSANRQQAQVTAQTRAIDGMRETRDEKLSAIQSLNSKLMDAKRQLAATPGYFGIPLTKDELSVTDNHENILKNMANKKENVTKLQAEFSEVDRSIQDESGSLAEMSKAMKILQEQIEALQAENLRLEQDQKENHIKERSTISRESLDVVHPLTRRQKMKQEVVTCCKKDDPKCLKYKGTKSTTSSGKKCQVWNLRSPHDHKYNKSKFDAGDFETNYCRNPNESGKSGGAWCYTMDKNKRWESCGIPTCQAQVSCDSTWTATNHRTSNPRTCQIYAQKKYCANGTYGSGWQEGWGTFEDWTDSEGRTALVCPECGCEGLDCHIHAQKKYCLPVVCPECGCKDTGYGAGDGAGYGAGEGAGAPNMLLLGIALSFAARFITL